MIEEDNLNLVTEWVWILFCYILFAGQKYLSSLGDFDPLLPEQPFYCQYSLPCKLFHLNGEYRYLRLLCPCCTYHGYSYTYVSGNQTVTVKELLGHKDLKMTPRYAHLAPDHKARAVNILDRVMAQNPPQAEKVVRLRG